MIVDGERNRHLLERERADLGLALIASILGTMLDA